MLGKPYQLPGWTKNSSYGRGLNSRPPAYIASSWRRRPMPSPHYPLGHGGGYSYHKASVLPSVIPIWNGLPENIKTVDSLNSFKRQLYDVSHLGLAGYGAFLTDFMLLFIFFIMRLTLIVKMLKLVSKDINQN